MDVWWLIVRTPGGVHCHELSPGEPDTAEIEGIVDGHGVPPDWLERQLQAAADGLQLAASERWDVAVAPGEPHPALLERATVHRQPEGSGS